MPYTYIVEALSAEVLTLVHDVLAELVLIHLVRVLAAPLEVERGVLDLAGVLLKHEGRFSRLQGLKGHFCLFDDVSE